MRNACPVYCWHSVQLLVFSLFCDLIHASQPIRSFYSSGQRFASGFLQTHASRRRPCLWLYSSHCRTDYGTFAPWNVCPPGTQKRELRIVIQGSLLLFFVQFFCPGTGILFCLFGGKKLCPGTIAIIRTPQFSAYINLICLAFVGFPGVFSLIPGGFPTLHRFLVSE